MKGSSLTLFLMITIIFTSQAWADAEISVSPLDIDFGEVELGVNRPDRITITNAGDADLTITDITIAGEFFQFWPEYGEIIVLEPDQIHEMDVFFSPEASGEFDGAVSIVSDAENGEIEVNLQGIGFEPADVSFSVTPDFVQENMAGGQQEQFQLTISNDGDQDITCTIDHEILSGPGTEQEGKLHRRLKIESQVDIYGMAYTTDNTFWASSSRNTLFSVDIQSGETLSDHNLGFMGIGLAFDGEYLWTVDYRDRELKKLNFEAETIESFDLDFGVYGVAFDPHGYLYLNEANNNRIHVFSIDTDEIVNVIDITEFIGNSSPWSMTWVAAHPEGQLWVSTMEGQTTQLYQFHVDENGQVNHVQNFRYYASHAVGGLTHDGTNLWTSAFYQHNWDCYDDGVVEWIKYSPLVGVIHAGESADVNVTLDFTSAVRAGDYEANLMIGTGDQTAEVNVLVQVDPPVFSIDPVAVSEGVDPELDVEYNVTVINTGSSRLDFIVEHNIIAEPDQDVMRRGVRSTSANPGAVRDEQGDFIREVNAGGEYQITGLAYQTDQIMWSSSARDGKIRSFHAITGDLLSEFDVGFTCYGLTFDGEYLWIGDVNSNNIHIYNLDGERIETLNVGFLPVGFACDLRDYVYVNEYNGTYSNVRVFSIDGRELVGSFGLSGALPGAIAGSMTWVSEHTGGNLWVLDRSGRDLLACQLNLSRPLNPSLAGSFRLESGSEFCGIASDGENLFIGMENNEGMVGCYDDGFVEEWLQYYPTVASVDVNGETDVYINLNLTDAPCGSEFAAELLFTTNDPDNPQVTLPVDVYIFAPEISVDPASIEVDLRAGEMEEYGFNILNRGETDLIYSITKSIVSDPSAQDAGRLIRSLKMSEHLDCYGVAYTGDNTLWATTSRNNLISVDLESGEVLASRDLGFIGLGLAGVGENFWTFDYRNSQLKLINRQAEVIRSAGLDKIFYGVAYDDRGYLWLAESNSTLIHVYSAETFERIQIIDVADIVENHGVWSLGWVPESQDGRLWLTTMLGSEMYLNQISIDDEWNARGIQRVRYYASHPVGGLTYDGSNLWTSSFWENNLYCIDDGQIEWLDYAPKSGTILEGEANDISVNIDMSEISDFGDYEANLIIHSNDPDNENMVVDVTVHVAPPVFEIDQAAIELNVGAGVGAEHSFSITNSGSSPLIYSVNTEIVDDEERDSVTRQVRSVSSEQSENRDAAGDDISHFELPDGHNSNGMTRVDDKIWICSANARKLYAIDCLTTAVLREFDLDFTCYGLAFDGENFWLGDVNRNLIRILNREGEQVDVLDRGFLPVGFASDRERFVYVADYRSTYSVVRVFNIDDRQEAFIADVSHVLPYPLFGSMTWINEHEAGNLWLTCSGNRETRACQIAINPGGQAELVSNFVIGASNQLTGIVSDGENLLVGIGYNGGELSFYEDGIEEGWAYCYPSHSNVAPGDNSEFSLRMNTESLESGSEYEANLIINTNDPDNERVVVNVTVQVEVASEIAVDLESHDFGMSVIGSESEQPFSIINTGSNPLVIENIITAGEYFHTNFDEAFSISPQESAELMIYFAPHRAGSYVGLVTIMSDDYQGDVINIPLLGQGVNVPPLVGILEGEYGNNIDVENGLMYVTKGSDGLWIIDISDPAHPAELAVFDTPGSAYEIRVVEGLAYIADDDRGLRIINVTDPENPVEIGFYDTPGQARGVDVSGDLAIVGDGDNGLLAIDISDPSHPELISTFSTQGSAADVRINVNRAYVACGAAGLGIFYIADPEAFEDIAYATTEHSVQSVSIVGNIAYICESSGGIRLIDLNDEELSTMGDFRTPQNSMAVNASISADVAYVADGDFSFKIVDFKHPDDAVLQAIVGMDFSGDALRIDDHVYVSNFYRGIYAFNVADLNSPHLTLSAEAIDFGAVPTGENDSQFLEITNDGDADLTVTDITVSGENFYIPFDGWFTIEPEESYELLVNFSPQREGEFDGMLRIVSDDAGDEIIHIPLSGVGESEPAIITYYLYFGTYVPGFGAQEPVRITIQGEQVAEDDWFVIPDYDLRAYNLGPSFLAYMAGISGTQIRIEEFGLDENIEVHLILSNLVVAPNEQGQAELVAIYSPDNELQNQLWTFADYQVWTDGPDSTQINVDEDFVFLNDKNLIVNFPMDEEFATMLALLRMEYEDLGSAFWDNEGDDWDLAEIEDDMVMVEGSPYFQVRVGHLSIIGGGPNGGFGELYGELAGEEDEHNFGNVEIEVVKQDVITLINSGAGELTITEIAVEGEQFGVMFDDAVTLSAGERYELPVNFSPVELANYEGAVTIALEHAENEQFVINLAGQGVEPVPEITYYLFFQPYVPGVGLIAPIQISYRGETYLEGETYIVPDYDLGDYNLGASFQAYMSGLSGMTITVEEGALEEDIELHLVLGNLITGMNEQGELELMGIYSPDGDLQDYLWTFADFQVWSAGPDSTQLNIAEHYNFQDGNHLVVQFPVDQEFVAMLRSLHMEYDQLGAAYWDPARGGWDVDGIAAQMIRDGGEIWFEVATNHLSYIAGGPENGFDEANGQIDLSSESIQFGSIQRNQTGEETLIITNTGGADLLISGIESDVEAFVPLFDQQIQIEPQGEYELTVQFNPTSDESYESALLITSNDPFSMVSEVSMNGTGINGDPEVMNPPEDVEIDEDSGLSEVADLNEIFSDPNGDALTYTLRGANELNLHINHDNMLMIQPADNFFGMDLEVTIEAEEMADEPGAMQFAGPVRQNNETHLLQQEPAWGVSSVLNRQEKRLPRQLRSVANSGAKRTPSRDLGITATFMVTVNPVNDSPELISQIEDVRFADVNGRFEVADLDDIFMDIDGESLEFVINGAPDGLNLSIDQFNVLYLESGFGFVLEADAEITISAIDGEGEVVVAAFTVITDIPAVRELTVSMNTGWNLISINVVPSEELWAREDGPDILLMTEQLEIDADNHHIQIMKDEEGRFYAPQYHFNMIPWWELTEGYFVKVDEDVEATYRGESIEFDADIPLSAGWNYAAYYPAYDLSLDTPEFYALSNIIDHVLEAKDGGGRFIAPEWRFSNMAPWRESQGYMIHVDEDVVLNYPAAHGEGEVVAGLAGDKRNHEALPVLCTDNNMSLLINLDMGAKFGAGDQISAFSEEGRLVGWGRVNEAGQCGLAVWGDDASSSQIDGLLEGEAFTLEICKSGSGASATLKVSTVKAGNGLVYEKDALSVVDAVLAPVIPDQYYLSNSYPNPFNSTTRFQYGLPVKSSVQITVFDVSGRVVSELANGEKAAGMYTLEWQTEGISAGVYFIRMGADNFNSVRKTVLMK